MRDMQRVLDRVIKKLENPDQFLDQLGRKMLQLIRRRFSTKRDPQGRAWAPWATSTMLARLRDGTASKGILVLTGRMRDSNTYTVQGNRLIISNRTPHALYHQFGGKHLPARPFIGWGPEEEKEAGRLWERFINND